MWRFFECRGSVIITKPLALRRSLCACNELAGVYMHCTNGVSMLHSNLLPLWKTQNILDSVSVKMFHWKTNNILDSVTVKMFDF